MYDAGHDGQHPPQPDPHEFLKKVDHIANSAPAPPLTFRRIRIKTIVWLCVAGVLFLAMIAGFLTMGSGRSTNTGATFAAILGLIVGLLALIPAVVYLIMDLTFRTHLDGPLETAQAFVKGIRQGRWDLVFQLTAPINRKLPTRFPPLRELGTPPSDVITFQSPADVKRYWAHARHPRGGFQRRLERAKVHHVLMIDRRVALAEAELRIAAYKSVYLYVALALFFFVIGVFAVVIVILAQKHETIPLYKTLVCGSDGRWYVMHGEIHGHDDEVVRSGMYDHAKQAMVTAPVGS